MTSATCHRCGAAIEENGHRLTISVVVRWDPGDREILSEYELCRTCASEAEDHLVLETTYHEPT